MARENFPGEKFIREKAANVPNRVERSCGGVATGGVICHQELTVSEEGSAEMAPCLHFRYGEVFRKLGLVASRVIRSVCPPLHPQRLV